MTDAQSGDRESRLSRRGLLAAAATGLTIGASQPATAGTSQPPADSPVEHVDHITEVRDDLDELREYAPKLHFTINERRQGRAETRGQYGWIAESDQYDVTAYYYWTRYTTQRSFLYYFGLDVDRLPVVGSIDSHYLDHEPTIQFVSPDGTVDSVVTTGGHHYAFEIDGEFGNLTEDRVSGRRTHVNLTVIRPWNHYVEAPDGTTGDFVEQYADFGSWLDQRDSWYRNGRYSSTAVEAIEDPFSFYDGGDSSDDVRTHWWVDGTWDAWLANNFYNRRVDTGDLRTDE